MMRRWMQIAVCAAAVCFASTARAVTRLEGFYEFLIDLRKQDRPYPWNFDSNHNDTFNQVELRLLTNPTPELEAFVTVGAEWNRGSNSNARPRFQVRAAHLAFRKPMGRRGVEMLLFHRQNRFWVENHLIQVVQDPWGGNGQGVRLNTWGFAGLNASFIYADFSSACLGQSRSPYGATSCDPVRSALTDDGYIIRVWRPFMRDRLRLGMTYNRRDEREEGDRVARPNTLHLLYTQTLAADMRLSLFNVDYRFEIARGRQNILDSLIARGDADVDWHLDKFRFGDPQAAFPDDIVMRAEARSLRLGRPSTGFLNVAPSVWLLGPQFQNQLGDGNKDEKGFAIDAWYLIPRRAITLTTRYVQWEKEFDLQRKTSDWFLELWTEYVNGFTTKFWYRRRRTSDFRPALRITDVTPNDDLFGEVVVESQLAWMRLQGLIKDIDTPFRRELMSFETSINITNTLKLYNRLSFGNDPARQRKALFSEIQYRPTGNVEVFLAYGPFWVGGGSNPVLEGNLQGGGDHRDLMRLLVRGNF